jgi:2'-5' RNA ligase
MTSGATWVPHMTLCYSTASQPADPIIASLGRELPNVDVLVDAVTLVNQRGAERSWDWNRVGVARLGATP